MSALSDEEIAAAERVLARATPGVWRVESCRDARDHEACKIVSDEKNAYGREPVIVKDCSRDECHHPMLLVDARAIVVAQQMAPKWLAELKAARGEIKRLERALEAAEAKIEALESNEWDASGGGHAV